MKSIFVFLCCQFLFLINIFAQEKNLFLDYNSKSILVVKKSKTIINVDSIDYDLLNALMFHFSNDEREKYKVEKFKYSEQLQKAAQYHSENMVKYKFYNHINTKNKDAKTYIDRIKKFGPDHPYLSENILYTNIYNARENFEYTVKLEKGNKVFYDADKKTKIEICTYEQLAKKLIKQWMDSKHHKENILNKKHQFLGISAVIELQPKNSEELIIVKATQNFAGN